MYGVQLGAAQDLVFSGTPVQIPKTVTLNGFGWTYLPMPYQVTPLSPLLVLLVLLFLLFLLSPSPVFHFLLALPCLASPPISPFPSLPLPSPLDATDPDTRTRAFAHALAHALALARTLTRKRKPRHRLR